VQMTKYFSGAADLLQNLKKFQKMMIAFLTCLMGVAGNVEAGGPKGVGYGSGVVIDDRGHIVTNHHVVSAIHEEKRYYCDKIYIKGGSYEGWARIVRREVKLDIAVLQLVKNKRGPSGSKTNSSQKNIKKEEGKGGWTSLSKSLSKQSSRNYSSPSQYRSANVFGSIRTTSPKPGEDIIAYGYPEIREVSDEPKVTTGVVSSIDGPRNDVTVFQHTASIYQGNSGGPLFDRYGQVLGINMAGYEKEGKGINFAIKGTLVAMVLERLDIATISQHHPKKLSVEQIAENASKFTVQIHCIYE